MFRKLIALALLAAGIAAAIKKSQESGRASEAGTAAGTAAPSPEPSAEPAPAPAEDQSADDLAEVRAGQTQDTVESPVAGVGGDDESVIPDTSAEDPLVREQEDAAAAAAGSIGGEADTADVDPEMRPVYEGSGDAPETLETTDEQGR